MKEIPVRQIQDTKERQVGRFSIRTIESLLEGKPLVQDLHRHNYFFVLVLKNGSGEHEIDFINYPVVDHSVFILRPGQVHQLKLETASAGFLMEFDSEFYSPADKTGKQRFRRVTSKSFCSLEFDRFERIYAALTYIYAEFTAKQAGYQELIKANLDIFFIEFLRQSTTPDRRSAMEFPYEQERFESFGELLEKHAADHYPVSRYAEMLGVSIYQLNKITKVAAGKTVSELINDQLVLESKRHLLATSNQVKETAYSLGFEDVSYFIRFFKKNTGLSPEAFRNQFK